jgi:hypothetical protein
MQIDILLFAVNVSGLSFDDFESKCVVLHIIKTQCRKFCGFYVNFCFELIPPIKKQRFYFLSESWNELLCGNRPLVALLITFNLILSLK